MLTSPIKIPNQSTNKTSFIASLAPGGGGEVILDMSLTQMRLQHPWNPGDWKGSTKACGRGGGEGCP